MTSTTTTDVASLTDNLDVFEAAVSSHFTGSFVDDIRDELQNLLDAVPGRQKLAGIALATAVLPGLDLIDRERSLADHRGLAPTWAHMTIPAQLADRRARTLVALDALRAGSDEGPLEEALAAVDNIRSAQEGAAAELTAALNRGELATVQAIRTRLEVDLPNELARAEAEVLHQRADLAAATVRVGQERARPAREARDELARLHREAEAEAARLLAAIRTHDAAAAAVDNDRRSTVALQAATDARRAAHTADARLEPDRVERVRRFAGLASA